MKHSAGTGMQQIAFKITKFIMFIYYFYLITVK